MEKDFQDSDFNPEMSEYNPLLSEIQRGQKNEDESFIALLIKKLTTNVVVAEW